MKILFFIVFLPFTLLSQENITSESRFYLSPDVSAYPNIDSVEMLKRINNVELKKKYLKNEFYISIWFGIDLEGNTSLFQINECKEFIACTNKLKNKKLHNHLIQALTKNIKWTTGMENGSFVRSMHNITFSLRDGSFYYSKKTPHNNS